MCTTLCPSQHKLSGVASINSVHGLYQQVQICISSILVGNLICSVAELALLLFVLCNCSAMLSCDQPLDMQQTHQVIVVYWVSVCPCLTKLAGTHSLTRLCCVYVHSAAVFTFSQVPLIVLAVTTLDLLYIIIWHYTNSPISGNLHLIQTTFLWSLDPITRIKNGLTATFTITLYPILPYRPLPNFHPLISYNLPHLSPNNTRGYPKLCPNITQGIIPNYTLYYTGLSPNNYYTGCYPKLYPNIT